MDIFCIQSSRNCLFLGGMKLISEISLVKYRISIFGIIEEGKEFLFNPHDSYTIKSGDILLLFGRKESIERVKN